MGEISNNKNSLKFHVEEINGKLYAATQKIPLETGNNERKSKKIRAVWEQAETMIIPIIQYNKYKHSLTKPYAVS